MPKFTVGAAIKYTLYIDESGDFASLRGQWVLAGVLLGDSYENCEKALKNRFKSIPAALNLRSIKDFHLTEFRNKFGHPEANRMARQVLRTLDTCPMNFHCVAAINFTKSELSEREKTYRLMLSDILALCETVLPDDQMMSKLDLVVASRTIDGIRQTTVSDIYHDVVKSLPLALEVDLATKGLVDLMGRNLKVHMDYANNSWGLVCSDFLANLNYHNRKNQEKRILNELQDDGKFSLFESFGGFGVRRAHVAERSRDYPLAIYRWIIIAEDSKKHDGASEAIQRLLQKIFTLQGTTGHEVAFEELIERLWRPNVSANQHAGLLSKLKFLEAELSLYLSTNNKPQYENLLFRLRNLMLIITNHLGNTVDAYSIIKNQRLALPVLATNPEYFSRILDFKISEAETSINALDFEKAMTLALEYSEIIDSYRGVWQLLVDEEDISGFEESRLHIKSEMSLLRIGVLCLGLFEVLSAAEIESRANKLETLINNQIDSSRFNNYKVMLLLRLRKPKEAICIFSKRLSDETELSFSPFDLLWFLRSVNDVLLSSVDTEPVPSHQFIEERIASVELGKFGHPNDIVMREIAFYEFLKGNRSKAKKLMTKSNKAMGSSESEISKFLYDLNRIHEDYIYGRKINRSRFMGDWGNKILAQEAIEETDSLAFLRKARYFSPY